MYCHSDVLSILGLSLWSTYTMFSPCCTCIVYTIHVCLDYRYCIGKWINFFNFSSTQWSAPRGLLGAAASGLLGATANGLLGAAASGLLGATV